MDSSLEIRRFFLCFLAIIFNDSSMNGDAYGNSAVARLAFSSLFSLTVLPGTEILLTVARK
jgi:hypothetical protein